MILVAASDPECNWLDMSSFDRTIYQLKSPIINGSLLRGSADQQDCTRRFARNGLRGRFVLSMGKDLRERSEG